MPHIWERRPETVCHIQDLVLVHVEKWELGLMADHITNVLPGHGQWVEPATKTDQ